LSIYPLNALTVDLEDWFHICGLPGEPRISPDRWRLRENCEKILSLLAEHDIRATFFVLGAVADAIHGLVPRIAEAGHEIASHGYSHRLATELGPSAFRDEIRRTGEILERQSGQRAVGFRAPQWSLSSAMPWAFEILHEEGYLYDSSYNPLPFVGDPAGPRTPYRVKVKGGALWEIPPMVSPSLFGNLPTGGGWGLRFFPLRMIRNTIRDLNGAGAPAVIYVHPRELDPEGPRLRLNPLKEFVSYGPRTDLSRRLKDVLKGYRFTTLREMACEWTAAS
jgi:polysaccharide deacetylase family protein (PEP-CTERM system associated)